MAQRGLGWRQDQGEGPKQGWAGQSSCPLGEVLATSQPGHTKRGGLLLSLRPWLHSPEQGSPRKGPEELRMEGELTPWP